jgi:hypothetical protein
MNTEAPTQTPQPKQKFTVSIDMRFIIVLLILVIAGMLLAWHPWNPANATNDKRTISVTGESTLQAEPDQFTFNPSYEFKDASRDTALANLSAKNTDLVAKLKSLGVSDNSIKTNASDYNRGGVYYPQPYVDGKPQADPTAIYNLQLTVTVKDRALAQKVQDYLATTGPSGAVTPFNDFSDAKRKQLESQARDTATKDARAKADQSAKNLGFKVGKVKSVQDGSGFGSVMPMSMAKGASVDAVAPSATSSIAVQPGQNPLSYSVTVEYYLQ